MKRLFCGATVALSLLANVSFAEPQEVLLDGVVAVVGGSSVLRSEVEQYEANIQKQHREQGQSAPRDTKAMALEELMTTRLLATQAQLDSLMINSGDITAQVEARLSSMRDQAGGLLEFEREQGMEIYNVREILRRRSEEQAWAQVMQSDVIGKVTITPGEVERYYKRRDRDSLPMIGEQYRYAHITRMPSNLDEAKLRVREQLLEMRERIISGKTRFSVLAQMYSVDPGSAYRGGEMEPQPASAFVPSFAEALEHLQPDQVSEIVETEFGFHIIQLIDKRGNLYHCRHILLRPSFSAVELMEPLNLLDSLAGVIRRDSITFERAAELYSDDVNSKMNGGIVSNHDLLERYNAFDAKLTVTKFLKEDFGNRGYKSLDDLLALNKLKVGEVSNAFTTQDMVGTQMSKIVKLVQVYPAHVASLDEDYIRLEQMALTDKQERIFDEWLDKHILSTYIYIDPEYRNLDFENPHWVR